ncbi:28S ribosomal protein S36, mitochondrial isoform X1 [Camponotus floridanus]|uniref:28S ribosomal protein S36, mitochondrial isoform X1 n=1 Tax=Camponotus floridanus TaxID=104421 RepID=UPI00059B5563|nr:28S ribosomal protein S36, mitochondrial isoform X1 [Camponotus floridanus]XP_011262339.1 28S ribosomal protein S36, mitochondrial isoform X1 [Camponotus floridanus]XP_011262340.1 28S ribosomal protein S36, mitochondrial isoform X1 [Camponotus floridanus]
MLERSTSVRTKLVVWNIARAYSSEKKKIMMASKAWKVVQPHVPMIKFRKGGANRAAVAGTTAAPSTRPGASQMQQSAGGATGPRVIVLPTIEDIHLPLRYQRRPIDPKEMEYINRGGPE